MRKCPTSIGICLLVLAVLVGYGEDDSKGIAQITKTIPVDGSEVNTKIMLQVNFDNGENVKGGVASINGGIVPLVSNQVTKEFSGLIADEFAHFTISWQNTDQDYGSDSITVRFKVKEKNVPEKIIWEKDGTEMVLIPSGTFKMGDTMKDPEDFMQKSRPVHTVRLRAFYIDVYEVTVGQYKQFLKENPRYRTLPDWIALVSPTDKHPVVGITWNDAQAYANWVGKRLPTEAEWEKAARGNLENLRYVWGNNEPDGTQCNYTDKNADVVLVQQSQDYKNAPWADMQHDDGYAVTAPVGSFAPNGYGLYDMDGNVSEYCSDWFDENYYSTFTLNNPLGPDLGSFRVVRGGSWGLPNHLLRVAYRSGFVTSGLNYYNGFRCVADVN